MAHYFCFWAQLANCLLAKLPRGRWLLWHGCITPSLNLCKRHLHNSSRGQVVQQTSCRVLGYRPTTGAWTLQMTSPTAGRDLIAIRPGNAAPWRALSLAKLEFKSPAHS
jgi:hypothetical protein